MVDQRGFPDFQETTIGAFIFNYLYYFGGFLVWLEHSGRQNPILIIQAPIFFIPDPKLI